jgi:deoxyribonuclease IV
MCNALREGERLKMDTVQVFTKNQQQWKAPPLVDSAVREWRSEVERLGWQGRIPAHASYLINLASPSDELWKKSIESMCVELERCEALGIPFLVHHPGSPTGAGREFGIARIVEGYRLLFQATKGFRTVSCLENTVGAGSTLGGPFEELAELRRRIAEATGEPGRVGFCFDTCHAHAAGYDLSTCEGAERALAGWDGLCGLAHIRVVHVNDSKGGAGSHLDRHEHIGEGTIGVKGLSRSGFVAVVRCPDLREVPKILETPKGENAAGTPYDTLNLRRLRKLAPPAEPIKQRGQDRKSRRQPATP